MGAKVVLVGWVKEVFDTKVFNFDGLLTILLNNQLPHDLKLRNIDAIFKRLKRLQKDRRNVFVFVVNFGNLVYTLIELE